MRIDEDDIPNNIFTRDTFEAAVNAKVDAGMSHLEAILKICEDRGLDVEAVADLVGPDITARLEECFVDLNYLKSRPTLPTEW